VARNRKRAKERRSRRPASGQSSRPGVATARSAREALENDAPSPLEHATPDAELADAQLALGRPDLADAPGPEPALESEPDPEADDFAEEEFRAEEDAADGVGGPSGGSGSSDGHGGGGGRELAAPGGGAAPAARRAPGGRLVNFLKGSWRELQRVQWPDRRQVMQATGVVVGFVIVAGVYLGIADTLATRLMNFILK
jgi:preprotein translocase subunit SecE